MTTSHRVARKKAQKAKSSAETEYPEKFALPEYPWTRRKLQNQTVEYLIACCKHLNIDISDTSKYNKNKGPYQRRLYDHYLRHTEAVTDPDAKSSDVDKSETDPFHSSMYATKYGIDEEDQQFLSKLLQKNQLYLPADWVTLSEENASKNGGHYRAKIQYKRSILYKLIGNDRLKHYGYKVPREWLDATRLYGQTPKTKLKKKYEIEKKKLINSFNYDILGVVGPWLKSNDSNEARIWKSDLLLHDRLGVKVIFLQITYVVHNFYYAIWYAI